MSGNARTVTVLGTDGSAEGRSGPNRGRGQGRGRGRGNGRRIGRGSAPPIPAVQATTLTLNERFSQLNRKTNITVAVKPTQQQQQPQGATAVRQQQRVQETKQRRNQGLQQRRGHGPNASGSEAPKTTVITLAARPQGSGSGLGDGRGFRDARDLRGGRGGRGARGGRNLRGGRVGRGGRGGRSDRGPRPSEDVLDTELDKYMAPEAEMNDAA